MFANLHFFFLLFLWPFFAAEIPTRRSMNTWIIVFPLAVAAVDLSLRDHPIASSAGCTYLDDGAWTASTHQQLGFQEQHPPQIELTIPATVPGDLLTDLQRANVIADPWLDTTWIQNSSLWTDRIWTYSTNFTISEAVIRSKAALLLTFDGVKMGATVRVNGVKIGIIRDQFLRYTFALGSKVDLRVGAQSNRLDVTFGVQDVAEDGRFMACTGGWVCTIPYFPRVHTHTHSHACLVEKRGKYIHTRTEQQQHPLRRHAREPLTIPRTHTRTGRHSLTLSRTRPVTPPDPQTRSPKGCGNPCISPRCHQALWPSRMSRRTRGTWARTRPPGS